MGVSSSVRLCIPPVPTMPGRHLLGIPSHANCLPQSMALMALLAPRMFLGGVSLMSFHSLLLSCKQLEQDASYGQSCCPVMSELLI